MSADNIEATEARAEIECLVCGTITDRWEHGERESHYLCHACHAQALADLGQPATHADPRFAALGKALAAALVERDEARIERDKALVAHAKAMVDRADAARPEVERLRAEVARLTAEVKRLRGAK